MERHRHKALFNSCSKSSAESTELQTLRSSGQEEKRKKIRKEIGMMRRRQVGGMKAPRWKLWRRKSQHAKKWNACSR